MGLALAVLIMIPLVPVVDYLDNYLLTDATSPFLLLVLSILMIVYYPNSGKWTPTRYYYDNIKIHSNLFFLEVIQR